MIFPKAACLRSKQRLKRLGLFSLGKRRIYGDLMNVLQYVKRTDSIDQDKLSPLAKTQKQDDIMQTWILGADRNLTQNYCIPSNGKSYILNVLRRVTPKAGKINSLKR